MSPTVGQHQLVLTEGRRKRLTNNSISSQLAVISLVYITLVVLIFRISYMLSHTISRHLSIFVCLSSIPRFFAFDSGTVGPTSVINLVNDEKADIYASFIAHLSARFSRPGKAADQACRALGCPIIFSRFVVAFSAELFGRLIVYSRNRAACPL